MVAGSGCRWPTTHILYPPRWASSHLWPMLVGIRAWKKEGTGGWYRKEWGQSIHSSWWEWRGRGCFKIKGNKVGFLCESAIESTNLSHMQKIDFLLGCQNCWLVMVSCRVPIFAHIQYSWVSAWYIFHADLDLKDNCWSPLCWICRIKQRKNIWA